MSKGKHRRSNIRRVIVTMTISALAVMGTGVGFALAQSPPAVIRIAGDPVIAPEPAAVPAPPQASPAPKTYTVRGGDSVWSIAASQCHDGRKWNVLASANHIRYPYPVTPGQKIMVAC